MTNADRVTYAGGLTGPEQLRAFDQAGGAIGVDRANNIIRGCIICEAGIFKSERGRFDDDTPGRVVELMSAAEHRARGGVACRFCHPEPGQDSLGRHLGRWKNPRVDGSKVRADLKFDRTALSEPPFGGPPLGVFLMDLAESDPYALGVSLVLQSEKRRTDRDGFGGGTAQPPLWWPVAILYADLCASGDATSSFLGWPGHDYDRQVAHARWRHAKRVNHEREVATARWRHLRRKSALGL